MFGMIGSKNGWQETSYLPLPTKIATIYQKSLSFLVEKIIIKIIPGLASYSPANPNVMRGEETPLLGLLNKEPLFKGWVCIPGTHSKWIKVRDGKVINFYTFLTGDLFSAISQATILKFNLPENHSINFSKKKEKEELQQGITEGLNSNYSFFKNLFHLRSKSLLQNQDSVLAYCFLSGLLVGEEIKSIKKMVKKEKVLLLAEGSLQKIYQQALKAGKIKFKNDDIKKLMLQGLIKFKNETN